MTNEYNNSKQLAYPGVYQNDNEIIPHSPRRQFGFAQPSETTNNRTIEIDSMRNMSIDQIVDLYKNGYRIETSPTHTIETASDGITVSDGIIMLIGVCALVYILLKRY